jgi:AcrR family transcriptional regulator
MSAASSDQQPPTSPEDVAFPVTDDSDLAEQAVDAETSRRLRADAARNRERVIAAATASFAEEGIDVPMETIAKRAGVGVGTIYRQFPTKENLFLAVVHHEMQGVAEFARQLSRADDPGAALSAFLGRVLDTVASKRDLAQALEHSGAKTPPTPEMQEFWRAMLAPLVDRARDAGAVRSDVSVDEVLFLISGTCSAVVNHAPDEQARKRMADVVCDGLRSKPTESRQSRA